jgi:hypothetical protein
LAEANTAKSQSIQRLALWRTRRVLAQANSLKIARLRDLIFISLKIKHKSMLARKIHYPKHGAKRRFALNPEAIGNTRSF